MYYKKYLTSLYRMWQVLVYLVFRQTVARCKQPVIQYSVTTTTAVAQVARLIVGVRKLGLVVNVCGFRFTVSLHRVA